MVSPATKTTIQIQTIGTVRHHPDGFSLQIEPPYRPALKEMDQFSHIHVLWWADRMDGDERRQMLQTELPYAPGTQAGVFACRAEYRPNPIGLTVCPILGVDEKKGLVKLAYIDAFDGTPILDLKPYIPISDRIRDVKVPSWLQDWPMWMEEAAEYFIENPVDFGD